ncbi:hypothetical protein ACL03H_11530 [Saccharopolyspora sp. MS10]|uniref:hypothetical protein n=1 Tax=Saccharopolyspora sp. MS10 TaxID=3385973 RepID=UPI0039A023E8
MSTVVALPTDSSAPTVGPSAELGEVGASLLLMAKPRREEPENVRRCFELSDGAIAEVASLLSPGDSRR